MNDYTLIRKARKTISILINDDGTVTVKAPLFVSKKDIDEFVDSKSQWIENAKNRIKDRNDKAAAIGSLSNKEILDLAEKAMTYIPNRVKYYANIMNVKYGKITIRCQKTRWGSCSAKGNLNFNCLLMLTPFDVIDSVIVHELCHLKELNHSKRFYNLVYKYFPNYSISQKWLKENGGIILRKIKLP